MGLEQEISKLEAEITDLGSRLYYCSNSPDGKKTRREIASMIKKRERRITHLQTR